ncbi:glycoside hydrolase family 26 protein [Jiangella mangrovi]|uniref:GH26 domain-containing protein n=1 Tax=Jiangella mangrovi TaxID=1524084 RepID=A0A7W9GMJ2_9ACTN|nr:glycosyl hydrolase [Jiangella mangrovi]MBB5786428.1 hypothetical protein [Jiangella mangrovi]
MSLGRRSFLGVAGGVAAGVALGGTLTPSAAAVPRDRSELIPSSGAHLGVYAYAGNDAGVSQPEALESRIGHQLRINHCFHHYGTAPHTARWQNDIAAGRIPMISWGAGPQTRLQEIADGLHDDEISGQATLLASLEAPLFLRFTWEFDLRYTDTALFREVWTYVHAKFAGAPNVAFVWCPTWRAYRETFKADAFYPGDAFVDWIAADAYARPHTDPAYHYRPFDLMMDTAHAFAADHGKPFMVGETGVHRAAVDPVQAAWLTTTRSVVKSSYPQLKAFVYFHRDGDAPDGDDWRVTVPDGGPAQQAFAAFAHDPYFDPS